MDTDELLQRCADIDKGLHELADDLYAAWEEGIAGKRRDDLVSRAKAKIQLYDELSESLEDEDEKEEVKSLSRYMRRMRRYIQRIESGYKSEE